MTELIYAVSKLAVGGFILVLFGQVVLRSLWDNRTRDDLLSVPQSPNPPLALKAIFALQAAALLGFGGYLVISSFDHFAAVFN